MPMTISAICATILDESSTRAQLRAALDAYVRLCAEVTGVRPDPSFSAWAEDAFLNDGVAINPQAAAHCAVDYQRSVTFIRAIHAALRTLQARIPDAPIEILYAGCGPFATLLLPLLDVFSPGELKLYLLDYHRQSLDSVARLLAHFGFADHAVETVRGDACTYRHPGTLHLIVSETMQKALEQEPQFAVTANLAPQLDPRGLFLPQRIDVDLCLAELAKERALYDATPQARWEGVAARRCAVATVLTLSPETASAQMQRATERASSETPEVALSAVTIPALAELSRLDAVLYTRICVYAQYCLKDYESQITLPVQCHDLSPLVGGVCYRVSYRVGHYPKLNFEPLAAD